MTKKIKLKIIKQKNKNLARHCELYQKNIQLMVHKLHQLQIISPFGGIKI